MSKVYRKLMNKMIGEKVCLNDLIKARIPYKDLARLVKGNKICIEGYEIIPK